ncbi:MAG: ZIP family metal transporter [Chitinivibrionales bacterium]|nr:ZIP family metal transporter [Chitinivibrionales bacterium]
MNELLCIIIGGFLMSLIAVVGGFTAILQKGLLDRILLPIVALAAGTLLGGALFHMIPEAIQVIDPRDAGIWVMGGFITFLGLEQFLHWHNYAHHSAEDKHKPMTYLVLIGDGIHNFLGGLGIASTFLIDPRAGIAAWIAAAGHEIPQEFGDFGVLVHGGWNKRTALILNVLSALTFPAGAILAYYVSLRFETAGLVLFGAGNFIYIAASDLVPEIKLHKTLWNAIVHFSFLVAGMLLMLVLSYAF